MDEVFPASLESVKKLGWRIVMQDPTIGEIRAKTGATLKSWGEDVTIKALVEPTQTTISVVSGSAFQLFDWGKSAENEKAFIEELKKTISRW